MEGHPVYRWDGVCVPRSLVNHWTEIHKNLHKSRVYIWSTYRHTFILLSHTFSKRRLLQWRIYGWHRTKKIIGFIIYCYFVNLTIFNLLNLVIIAEFFTKNSFNRFGLIINLKLPWYIELQDINNNLHTIDHSIWRFSIRVEFTSTKKSFSLFTNWFSL